MSCCTEILSLTESFSFLYLKLSCMDLWALNHAVVTAILTSELIEQTRTSVYLGHSFNLEELFRLQLQCVNNGYVKD